MKRLLPLLAVLIFAPSAHAAHHLMTVNRVDASPTDVNKQFVELLDTFGEPFPNPQYSLGVFNAGGSLVASQVFNKPFGFANRTTPYLIGKAGVAGRNELLTLTIPNAPGKVCFHSSGSPTQADAIHCRAYGGSSGGGGTVDRRKPKQTLGGRTRQKLKGLAVTVRVDEAARVVATGSVRFGKRKLSLTRVTRNVKAGQKATLKLKLSRKRARAVRAALRARRRVTVKLKISARDAGGNVGVARRSIRLTG